MVEVFPTDRVVVRPGRQRVDRNIDDLLPSIKARGIITPIILEEPGTLVAGERRLMCAKEIGLPEVPIRWLSALSPIERQIIELEENIHRSPLIWQEFCLAVKRIHEMYCEINPHWPQEKTAESLCIPRSTVSIVLMVADEVKRENPRILSASGWRNAYNIIARTHTRRAEDAFNELMEEDEEPAGESAGSPARTSDPSPELPSSSDRADSFSALLSQSVLSAVQQGDFREWAGKYTGPLFQFVHCDFPYGIELDKSAQGYSTSWGGYVDSRDTYWQLIECFCTNIDRIMSPNSHLMFWLSSDISILWETISYFQSNTDLSFNLKPLIWHKSDNRGILADPKRGPRHVYETAIFASRGDRFINQAVSDAYSAPAGEKAHQSEKSEPMLRHFFRMFVHEGTRFLDPTCGNGSSLCAADSLGANVFGLEVSEEFVEGARTNYRRHLNLKRFSKGDSDA